MIVEREKNHKKQPTVAPGIDNDEELEQKATQLEKDKGEYTQVTALINDEVN